MISKFALSALGDGRWEMGDGRWEMGQKSMNKEFRVYFCHNNFPLDRGKLKRRSNNNGYK
jgi:hypothetical protein